MIAFVNGHFVPESQAVISIFDRGFLYGDGVFEAIRVYDGRPFRWDQHFERFRRGAEYLRISIPFPPEALAGFVRELIQRHATPDSIVRMVLSRGTGARGYSPKGADRPTLVMSLHPAPVIDPLNPPRWRLITSSFRVPAGDPVANYKTCNKLYQVLARAEAEERGADDALILNTDGAIAETAGSNLFWVEGGTVCTPPLSSGILAGITRGLVLELCQELGISAREKLISTDALRQADSIFLTVSTWEIVDILELDGLRVGRSPIPDRIREAYRRAVAREKRGS